MSAEMDHTPKRGFVDDPSDSSIEDITATPSRAKRGRARSRFGKGAVAATVAGALAAGTLFAYAFAARDDDPGLESLGAEAAIPAAAVEAAQQGFANRSADVSRSVVRDGLSEAAADTNARDRAEAIDQAADDALRAETSETAEERVRLMDGDMELVEAQAAKLKAEAEEAERLIAEAQQIASAAGFSTSGMSAEDVKNLTTKGASMPVKSNFRVGAGFGRTGIWARYHTGQDFPAPTGTPVYAVASGVVLSPTAGGWAGVNVVVQHRDGATLSAHLSRSAVSPGQTVKAGDIIGYVGNTGRSYGSHLHFEFYKNGTTPGDVYSASNPMTFLQGLGA
ncbi:MAG: peptidoglycan DD-metalloendopeptidase family protein [Propionibacterium sp.]|nr:peptidoglycan DD-metalloendopeptidase family protein [Propionibacterium sp.]